MPDRKFATWTHEHETGRHDFDVRMKWGYDDGAQHPVDPNNIDVGTDPTFYIDAAEPPISVEDGSLTALAKKLREAVADYYGMVWTPMLGIHWESRGRHRDIDDENVLLATELSIKVEPWERGYSERTGKILWAVPDTRHKRRSDRRVYHEPPTFYCFQGGNRPIAFVPDTPENRAILTDLNGKLDKLAAILSDLLTGDNVATHLKTISALALPEKT